MGKVNHYRDEYAIKEFGKKIRALRNARNMTIEEFANSTDLHVNQLARIEREKTNLTISYFFRLAEIFKVEASELLRFDK